MQIHIPFGEAAFQVAQRVYVSHVLKKYARRSFAEMRKPRGRVGRRGAETNPQTKHGEVKFMENRQKKNKKREFGARRRQHVSSG